ncbi:hypothetical protein EDB80DRAFT_676765 [Ilyonectria destructans]|nr:hypothetical protein EDB80DRAFT_676765 [Ilyonectria destructans]
MRVGEQEPVAERAIHETPTGFDRVYDQDQKRILRFPERDRSRAFALLRRTACTLRSLTICEITDTVLIDCASDDLWIDALSRQEVLAPQPPNFGFNQEERLSASLPGPTSHSVLAFTTSTTQRMANAIDGLSRRDGRR